MIENTGKEMHRASTWEGARNFQPTLGTPPSQGLTTPEALPTTSVRICMEASLCRHDGVNHCHW